MIGIYKYENKINGKIYIGQSNNIERRFKEHLYKNDLIIEKVIRKYGISNFLFTVLEECQINDLDDKEIYYIQYYNSRNQGYNISPGGNNTKGENNGRTLLKNKDIINIRKAYNQHKKRKDVYELYKDKVTFGSFAAIWDGSTWKHIMPEVYTQENLDYFKSKTSIGELSSNAIFTDEEVIQIRHRYVNETAKEIYKDYHERCKYQTLQQILWGRKYKDLPIYSKKKREWIKL